MRKHKAIRSSMLRDLKNNKTTEIDAINGVVVSYGKEHGFPTPLNTRIIEVVHQIEQGHLSPSWDNLNKLKK